MYGTHYSNPGYVIGYLFRKKPRLMLHLQNGKFDLPDWLFYSIEHDYITCNSSQTCVRELIPEFYENIDSFLINKYSLDLGYK